VRLHSFILAVALVLKLTCPVAFAQGNVQQIIQKSVEAKKADWKVDPEYDYFVKVKKGGHTNTYDVRMILGSPYEILIAVDGKPLSANQKADEQRKLEQATEARRKETPQQRAARIAAWERGRQRNHMLMEEMAKAFDFRLKDTEQLNGREVYVLAASPRSGYQPPNNQAKVLTGMKGTMWIDKETYQWAKVQAEVIHAVSIEGFMARVEPGTRFELREAPVAQDVWLPTFFSYEAHAKIFFVVPKNSSEEDTYYGYRKATESTSGAAASPSQLMR
jgi:outer membrane lipoprotein-sorting protein